MPGKRINDPSLQPTWYDEAIANDALLLTDWTGLEEARPIPIKYIGNAWFQGSYDNATWSNTIQDDHNYARVSTDGGTEWVVFNLATATTHPALTLGSPTNGLVLDESNQVLTLNYADAVNGGALSSSLFTKLSNLKFDIFENLGGGFEIYKEYSDVGDNRTHSTRTLVAGTGATLSYVGDTIVIDATGAGGGEVNTASNYGTDGVGVYDSKSGANLRFRNLASIHSGLTITLDNTDHDLDFNLDETNIDHDLLLNFIADEHIDHSTVNIDTTEGIAGGGDLTLTRTLSLSFDTLSLETEILGSDILAFYRTGDDLHHGITYNDLEFKIIEVTNNIYVPLTTTVNTLTGLTGGGALSTDISIGLAFNNLPNATFDPAADYIAIYDASNGTHAKILVGAVTSVNISAGNGMNFTNITGTGSVTLGTPSTLTESTTNQATGTTHTHVVDLSTWELEDLGDVPAPTPLYYLRRNAGNTAYEWVDPAIGATTPGGPDTSLQFNNSGSFSGNAGLLYDSATDSIYFTDANASVGATMYFGTTVDEPYIKSDANQFLLSNFDATNQFIQLYSNRLILGDPIAESDYFIGAIDPNVTPFTYTLRFQTNLGLDTLMLKNSGEFYLPELTSATTEDVLYFDSATGLITYGAKPTTTGGIQTLIADSLSGLMVNFVNTSSASSIQLDQNDNKLGLSTIALEDYIGFYDVTYGLQKKTTLANFPGISLYLDGVLQEQIKLGDNLKFVSGSDVQLSYNSTTNELTVNYVGGANPVIEDIAFDFNDVTGVAQTYILDLETSFDYIVTEVVIQSDDNVAFTVEVDASAIVTDTATASIQTFTAGDTVNTGSQITLNLSASSATLIRGKLRIQRV